jgi:hypothetical protein
MAGGGADRGDDLDGLVLDETFVRAASRREAGAGERERAWAKANRRHRRQLRRRRWARRYRTAAQALVLVAGVAAVAVAAGFSGQGPLASLRAPVAPEHEQLVSDEASTETPSSSTTVRLERRSFDIGDCVVWDQRVQWASANVTSVVPCDEPHLMEVTGKFTMSKGPYPSEPEWDAIFDTGRCAEMGAAYLGGHLDPSGMYAPRGIIPLADGWLQGDREVWCGLWRYPLEEVAASERYTGKIDPSAQHRLYPVGACLGPDGDGLTGGTVPCDAPHVVEISGHVDLAGRVQAMPTRDQYDGLVGDACERLGSAYARGNFRAPVHAGWLDIEQGSWDSGRRVVTCTVAEYRNEDALTITRRLGPPPA